MTEKIPVLYEDDGVIIIDKPAGINVHVGAGHEGEETIVELIKHKVEDDGSGRAGIVHRLDRDTSGVLITAKNAKTKEFLQAQFQSRGVEKEYLALVLGRPRHPRAVLDWPIGRHPKNPLKRAVRGNGKAAITEYRTKEEFKDCTLLEVRPKTGRMHQIRVHLSHLGHPIVGDGIYGQADTKLKRQFLHASNLKIKLPGGDSVNITSPLPPTLSMYLGSLRV